jgi:type I restriction enzyme S subunit
MELMPGYKRSDVGMIPIDWDISALGKLTTLVASGRSAIGKQTGDYPIYGSTGIIGYTMTPEYDGDAILAARVGANAGRLNYVSGKYGVTDNTIIIRMNRDCCLPFFWRQLEAKRLNNLVFGSGQPLITGTQLKALPLAIPSPAEQRAIAQALSDVDTLLATLDQVIAKKHDLKLAAMQQLLTGKARLPGFSRKWEVRTLFELAECKKEFFDDGDWIESEHITTEGIRLIQTGNIGIGSFVEKEDKKYINEASFSSLRCKQLKQGDLLICRLAEPAGRACVLGDIGEERIVTSVDVTIFRPPPELADRTFLVQAFSTADWFRAVSDRSGGTTHKRISRGALGRLSINLPPVPEQSAIARVLSDMDAELSVLEARRDKTRNIKQAMMQELLTGKTRLV